MTRDDIIRMAREACGEDQDPFVSGWVTMDHNELASFAALVAAAERNRTWTQAHWTEYERSIAATEREACAKVCESCWFIDGTDTANEFAVAIRARGQA